MSMPSLSQMAARFTPGEPCKCLCCSETFIFAADSGGLCDYCNAEVDEGDWGSDGHPRQRQEGNDV
jgi:hypothetical protein